jgi:hypothetical protein
MPREYELTSRLINSVALWKSAVDWLETVMLPLRTKGLTKDLPPVAVKVLSLVTVLAPSSVTVPPMSPKMFRLP